MNTTPYQENYLDQGAFYALLVTVFGTLVAIANRFAILELETGIFPLIILQSVAGGMVLFLVGFRRYNMIELDIFAHPLTWGIGFCRTALLFTMINAYSLSSVAEAEFVIQFHVIIALITAYFLHGTYPQGRLAWAGLLILIGGLSYGMGNVPPTALMYIVLGAFLISLEGTLAESHHALVKSYTWRQHMVFSGVVMIVTGLVVAVVWALSLLVVSNPPAWESFAEIFSWKVLLTGVLIGTILRSMMILFRHKSIRLLGNAYYLMAISLTPFVAIALESTLSYLDYLPAPSLDSTDLAAGCVIALGNLLILIGRMIREQKRPPHAPAR